MFGEEAVPKIFKGDDFYITVNQEKAHINLTDMVCPTLRKPIITIIFIFLYVKFSYYRIILYFLLHPTDRFLRQLQAWSHCQDCSQPSQRDAVPIATR